MANTPSELMRELDEQLKSDPARTEGLRAVFQFELSGDDGGSWWVEANDGTGEAQVGSRDDVNATIRMKDEVFVSLGARELDGSEAYMDGLLTVEGDQSKAMFLAQIFGE
jgi:putative sterol carrier protein